jgi:hypothetical protein
MMTRVPVFLFMFVAVLVFWFFYPLLLTWVDQYVLMSSDAKSIVSLADFGDKYGVFGDTYGALNSLFSALAALGLFFSIMLQNESIKKAKDDFGMQVDDAKKQNFSNHFFFILEQRASFIQDLKVKEPHTALMQGSSALAFVSQSFLNSFQRKEKFFSEDIKDKAKFIGYFRNEWASFDTGQKKYGT